jgi:hypothetical protein
LDGDSTSKKKASKPVIEDDNLEDENRDNSDSDYVGEGASKKASKPVRKFRPFTNGLDLDAVTKNFQFIVEQEKEK